LKYNLRLSDGTDLVVDYDELATWLVDEGAMVQVVGSNEWRPLTAALATGDPVQPSPIEPKAPAPVRPPPRLMVLADDLAVPSAGSTVQAFAPGDDLPLIPLKPPDASERMRGVAGSAQPDADSGELVDPAPWHDPRDDKLFSAIAEFGGFLSVWLDRLDRQLKRLWSRRP